MYVINSHREFEELMRVVSQTIEAIRMRKQTTTNRFNHNLTHLPRNVSEKRKGEKVRVCEREKDFYF